jgi:hypothetical protein
VAELPSHTGARIPRQHEHRPPAIGEEADGLAQRPGIDVAERLLDVVALEMEVLAHRIVGGRFTDALGRRPQPTGQLEADRLLQVGEPVEADLGGQADHRGGTGGRGTRQIGHRAERDELGLREHHFRDAPLRLRERVGDLRDPPTNVHVLTR